jgi:hypothetical protein
MVGMFSAQAGTVESVNMVGFANVNLGEGMNIIGVPFVTVGDTETTLDNLFDLSEFTAGAAANDSDVVYVWTGIAYDGYFLCNWTGTGYDETAWSSFSAPGVAVDVTLAPGEAVWLNRQAAAADITYKGEVMTAAATDVALSTGMNMISYPYSVSAKLADFDVSAATAGAAANDSDVVYVWTGTAYDGYFLCNWTGTGYDETAWSSFGAPGVVADVDMDIGKGAWYDAQSAFTLSAAKPY